MESALPEVPDTFEGLVPSPRDLLGDNWSRAIGDLFDRTRDKFAPELVGTQSNHRVWLIWQWMYCGLAGMRSRVIASPQAVLAAGLPLTKEEIELAEKLVRLSPQCL